MSPCTIFKILLKYLFSLGGAHPIQKYNKFAWWMDALRVLLMGPCVIWIRGCASCCTIYELSKRFSGKESFMRSKLQVQAQSWLTLYCCLSARWYKIIIQTTGRLIPYINFSIGLCVWNYRLKVVPLSLSPSCVTPKKTPTKTGLRNAAIFSSRISHGLARRTEKSGTTRTLVWN